MSDMTLLRIGIAVAMSLLFGAIIYFGRGRKNAQGRRVPRDGASGEARTEPSLGDQFAEGWDQGPARQEELALDGSPAQSELGKRVYNVPEEIDHEIARLKLRSMEISIDELTDEQVRYMNSWDQGT